MSESWNEFVSVHQFPMRKFSLKLLQDNTKREVARTDAVERIKARLLCKLSQERAPRPSSYFI